MSMPTLDPSRYFEAVLADTSHKLPLPGRDHHFAEGGEMIDSLDPHFAALLADGSLKRKAIAAADEGADASADPEGKGTGPADPGLRPRGFDAGPKADTPIPSNKSIATLPGSQA